MARLTGKDAAVKVAAAVFNKCRSWEYEPEAITADGTAAGDALEVNVPLRSRYTVRAEFIMDDAQPFVVGASVLNTAVAFVLMINAAHVNGLFAGTGILVRAPVNVPYDDVVTMQLEWISDGTAPTIDLSPLT